MTTEEIRKEAFDLALHTYGTHYIYSIRQQSKSRWLKAISMLGFIVPVLLGGIVSSYGFESTVSHWALATLTPIGLFQLCLSTLSLIYQWEEQSNYYLASSVGNRLLSDEFHKLAKYPIKDLTDYNHSYQILLERNRNREEQDDKYPFTDKETRRGLRYALRQFQRECIGCREIPTSILPNDCHVCGNF